MAEEYKIAEYVVVQDHLSPVIFDENAKMFETVRIGLQRIADYWWDNAMNIFPDFKLKEVVLYGDIAGYVYNKKSEVWLGCVAEISDEVLPYLDRINEVFVATEMKYKFIHRPVHCRFLTKTIDGIPTYSITQDKWLTIPQKREFKFNLEEFELALDQYQKNVHDFVNSLPKADNNYLLMDSCRKLEPYLQAMPKKAYDVWANDQEHEYSLDYLLWRSFKEMKGEEYFNSYLSYSLNYNVNVLEECW